MNEQQERASGAPVPEPQSSTGKLVSLGVLRVLVGEYSLLRDIATAPIAAAPLAPSVADAVEFLRSYQLVRIDGQKVAATDRGRQFLNATPISGTKYTLAFDRNTLGW